MSYLFLHKHLAPKYMKMVFSIFNKICVFGGHADYIKHIVKIDQNRYCTGGDDGMIIVINVKNFKQLHILKDHKLPITSMHCLTSHDEPIRDSSEGNNRNLLATSSADRRIIIWNIDDGLKLHVFTGLDSAAKCLGSFKKFPEYLISGGDKLVLWHVGGGYAKTTVPSQTEYVRFVIFLQDKYVIAAIDDHPVVISVSKDQLGHLEFDARVVKLKSHREAITCLVKVDDHHFLSGSLDGLISHWSLGSSWERMGIYNYVDQYLGQMKVYPYSVQCLKVLEDKFLIAGIGHSFTIFNLTMKTSLFTVEDAHDGKINYIDVVYDGQFIATCSEDALVKIWKVVSDDDACKDAPLIDVLKKPPIKVELVEVCAYHTASIMKCMPTDGGKFMTCGNDMQIILWMDGFAEELAQYKEIRELMPY